MAEYGSPHSLPLEFLDLTDSSLSVADKMNLSSIVQPTTVPLPGSGGVVWKTPRNISPDFEFGDGVSAVFKSLSVASPTPSHSSIPTTTHPPLSVSSTPFVPSIPIPLPTMGQGPPAHPQTIHINNFTANLNYHGIPSAHHHHNPLNSQESPVNSYPGPNTTPQPIPFNPRHYPGQYVAPFPMQGPAQLHHPYHHPAGLMYVSLPPSGYPGPQIVQHRPREEPQQGVGGGGITFGSTPVVSIRNEKTVSETEDFHPEDKIQNPSFTPSPIVPAPQVRCAAKAVSPPASTYPLHATPSPRPQPATAQTCNAEVAEVPRRPAVSDHPAKTVQGITPTNTPPQDKQNTDSVKQINPVPSIPPETAAQVSPNIVKPKSSLAVETNGESEPAKLTNTVVSPSPAPVGTWASLFTAKATNTTADNSAKPTARIQPFSSNDGADAKSVKEPNSAEKELGTFLNSYSLKHVATALLPRGLTNRSNWCFVNAILQALLACPPFYNLMKNLPNSVFDLKTQKSKTPMLDSIIEFVNEFSVLEQMNKNQKKDKNRKKDDVVTGICLEPSYVYKMLLNLEEDTFKVIDGRQEDAEEFLTCLLNGLSDEMLAMMKLAEVQPAVDEMALEAPNPSNEASEDAADDWQEVGAKGKSCVTRRVANGSHVQTPIQSMALGMCRSCVKSETGDNSATLQPFYTLQLDIQDQTVQNITEALAQNFANEKLDGFICSKTKKEIDATRILSLEELPSILILHLKRFVYDGQTGGVQKIMKQIEFGVDLEMPKAILSAECKASPKQRQYKLFGVVYHSGREATKGHYVTDIYHTGYATWLHCDDSIVQPTAEQLVVAPTASSTPYLLFYRRGDTMVGMDRKQ